MYYSIWDRDTYRYLATGRNRRKREESILDGFEFLLSDASSETARESMRKWDIQEKEEYLDGCYLHIIGHKDLIDENYEQ
jgi:hypothetical protein